MMFVKRLAWKNQKAFSSLTLLQVAMLCRHFVAKGKQLPGKHGMFTLKYLQPSTHPSVIGDEEQKIL